MSTVFFISIVYQKLSRDHGQIVIPAFSRGAYSKSSDNIRHIQNAIHQQMGSFYQNMPSHIHQFHHRLVWFQYSQWKDLSDFLHIYNFSSYWALTCLAVSTSVPVSTSASVRVDMVSTCSSVHTGSAGAFVNIYNKIIVFPKRAKW